MTCEERHGDGAGRARLFHAPPVGARHGAGGVPGTHWPPPHFNPPPPGGMIAAARIPAGEAAMSISTIGEIPRQAAARFGDKTALIFGGRRVSFAEIDRLWPPAWPAGCARSAWRRATG